MRALLLIALISLLPAPVSAQACGTDLLRSGESEPLEIYVITMGPGPDLFSQFGHAALYVRGEGDDTVYNFGMYEASDPELMVGFLSGVQPFYVARSSFPYTFFEYAGQERDIHLQRLDLPLDVKRDLAARLHKLGHDEDYSYIYHWYSDNCTTRIRDLIDAVTHGAFAPQHQRIMGLTAREEVLRLVSIRPEAWLGIHLIFGAEMDQPMSRWDAMFLPLHFREALAVTTLEGRPLVAETCQVYVGSLPHPPPIPPRRDLWLALFGMLLAAITLGLGLLAERHTLARIALGGWLALVGLVLTALGSFLAFMWLGSDLQSSNQNANLLLVSPLTLALVLSGVLLAVGRSGALRVAHALTTMLAVLGVVALVLAVLLGLQGAGQDHWGPIGLFLPLLIAAERSSDYLKARLGR